MKKPPALKIFTLTALVLSVSFCKQKETAKSDPVIPEVSYTAETVLVETGSSYQATFSPKGDRLLFVSAKRPSHAQAQVYEKDLTTGTETRITFQNGDVSHPAYHPKEDFILYSSSTDELKENPPLLKGAAAASPLPAAYQEPTELYLHSLNGLEITRLTETPGFDGEARFSNDGKNITWTRARNNKLETLQLHRSSHAVKPVAKLGANSSAYTTSPDGQWQAWLEWDNAFGVSKLRLQKGKADAMELNPDAVVPKVDLEFSPDSKWLFWAQFNTVTNGYQIWSIELASQCARIITENKEGDRRHPALSPDMKRLIYTATPKAKDSARSANVGASEGFRSANVGASEGLRSANVGASESFRSPYVQSRILQVGFAPPSGPCAGAR